MAVVSTGVSGPLVWVITTRIGDTANTTPLNVLRVNMAEEVMVLFIAMVAAGVLTRTNVIGMNALILTSPKNWKGSSSGRGNTALHGNAMLIEEEGNWETTVDMVGSEALTLNPVIGSIRA